MFVLWDRLPFGVATQVFPWTAHWAVEWKCGEKLGAISHVSSALTGTSVNPQSHPFTLLVYHYYPIIWGGHIFHCLEDPFLHGSVCLAHLSSQEPVAFVKCPCRCEVTHTRLSLLKAYWLQELTMHGHYTWTPLSWCQLTGLRTNTNNTHGHTDCYTNTTPLFLYLTLTVILSIIIFSGLSALIHCGILDMSFSGCLSQVQPVLEPRAASLVVETSQVATNPLWKHLVYWLCLYCLH